MSKNISCQKNKHSMDPNILSNRYANEVRSEIEISGIDQRKFLQNPDTFPKAIDLNLGKSVYEFQYLDSGIQMLVLAAIYFNSKTLTEPLRRN